MSSHSNAIADLRRLGLWIALSLVAEVAPLSVEFVAHNFSGHGSSLREVLGYSTSLLLAFSILLIAVCEVIVEGFWRLASDLSAALTIILLIIICQFSGWAISLDLQIRTSNKELAVEPAQWIWFELGAILTLILWGAQIRVWMMGQHRTRIREELRNEYEREP